MGAKLLDGDDEIQIARLQQFEEMIGNASYEDVERYARILEDLTADPLYNNELSKYIPPDKQLSIIEHHLRYHVFL